MSNKLEISRSKFDGVIFDLDGVITQSARIHAEAWKKMFDPFLEKRGEPPFDKQKDYLTYVDGKPRLDGIRSFLQSRGIQLEEGSEEDSEKKETIHGLGKQKNRLFLHHLHDQGIPVYQTSIEFVEKLREYGFKIGIISSSKNCVQILEQAHIRHLFEVEIDGIKSQKLHLKGKPAPDIFFQAAKELDVSPAKSVVVEDALSGVQAAKAGNFGLIIGVDRKGQAEALKKNGADIVVSDLKHIKIME